MNYAAPSQIARCFSDAALQKGAMPIGRLWAYSFLGGAYIALGGLLAIVVAGGMPGVGATDPGLVKFVFGALFPLGLVLVLLGGAELFTSDCAVLPFSCMQGGTSLSTLLKIWCVAFLGNFIGALFVGYVLAFRTGILSADPWHTYLLGIASHKVGNPFVVTFCKGVGANWLVCLAVWLSYAAKDVVGKVAALWFPVMCFVALGMEHSVANMFFVPTAIFIGANIHWSAFLATNLLPSTLGNIVGGFVLVALPYWYLFGKTSPSERKASALGTVAGADRAENSLADAGRLLFENS